MRTHNMKRVKNLITGKTFYFVDGKRVSKNYFDFLDFFLTRKDSFFGETRGVFSRFFFTGYSQ